MSNLVNPECWVILNVAKVDIVAQIRAGYFQSAIFRSIRVSVSYLQGVGISSTTGRNRKGY